MLSPWTRWRISTAIESGKPLSSRLARKVRCDPQLRRFHEASLAMAQRLRRDADAVVRHQCDHLDESALPHVAMSAPAPRDRRATRRAGLLALASAAAVVALIVGTGTWPRDVAPPPPDPPQPAVAQAQDIQELMEIARLIDATVEHVAVHEGPRLRARMARSRDAIRKPILREVSNMAADSRRILQRFFLLIPVADDPPGTEPPLDAPLDTPLDTPPPTHSDQTAPFSRSQMSLICSYATDEMGL